MKARAFVTAVGARSAIGHTAAETGFLLRTGLPVFAAAPLADAAGEPVTMGFDPTIDPYLTGDDRAAALAVTALEEAAAPISAAPFAIEARLVLCVDARGARLAHLVHRRAKELCPGIALEVVPRGAAGAAFALPAAVEALAARKVDAVILGGAHTDYDPAIIAALAAEGRLYSSDNPAAVVPGEAAAFALLTREDTARRLGLHPAARLGGVGTGTGKPRGDEDARAIDAVALTAALRAAAADLTDLGLRAGWGICDHTFETDRVLEWGTAVTRTHTLWAPPHRLDAPAQRLGHLGAAAIPLAIVIAAEAWRRGYAPSGVALAFAGSDTGERGAVLLFSNV